MLPIRLKIADREYPMQVEPAKEAELRATGREINVALKNYREEYNMDSYQDVLAMLSIDCVMRRKELEGEKNELEQIILNKLDTLEALLQVVV
ncbi:MAG: cell division protein ZapA [Thermonemataceae bacterium]|nr:cell division protein ZapA [Thermonemataceae bacterium]